MPKCRICQERDANQTGSHIIPHFLDKRIVNIKGEKGRDKELSFSISPTDQKFFIGRAVLPEQFDNILGKLSDERLENTENLSTEDYIFCSKCEKHLGKIESDYSKTLSEVGKAIYTSTPNGFLSCVFWFSIAYRLSITKIYPSKLKLKDENQLHHFLKKVVSYENWKDAASEMIHDEIPKMGYKLLRAINFSDSMPTCAFFHPKHQRPYCFIIDEFVLFLFMKESHQKGAILSFFDLETLHPHAPLNQIHTIERILSISHSDYERSNTKLKEFLSNMTIEYQNYLLHECFMKIFHTNMPVYLKSEFYRIYHGGETYGELKYSYEHFVKCLFHFISDLLKQRK